MSIQLTIDEMLDFLDFAQSPAFSDLRNRVEALADEIAIAVTREIPELTPTGPAAFEGTAFGGTCAPFKPTSPGPVPAVMEHFGVEVQEWKDMCDDL